MSTGSIAHSYCTGRRSCIHMYWRFMKGHSDLFLETPTLRACRSAATAGQPQSQQLQQTSGGCEAKSPVRKTPSPLPTFSGSSSSLGPELGPDAGADWGSPGAGEQSSRFTAVGSSLAARTAAGPGSLPGTGPRDIGAAERLPAAGAGRSAEPQQGGSRKQAAAGVAGPALQSEQPSDGSVAARPQPAAAAAGELHSSIYGPGYRLLKVWCRAAD